jgi:hypothetical protein
MSFPSIRVEISDMNYKVRSLTWTDQYSNKLAYRKTQVSELVVCQPNPFLIRWTYCLDIRRKLD